MILFILGSVVGIALMCLLQVNRDNWRDRRIIELENELKMIDLLMNIRKNWEEFR